MKCNVRSMGESHRGIKGSVLLALKMEEGSISQGMQKASRSWKRQGYGFSLQAFKKNSDLFQPAKFHFRLLAYRIIR